MRRAASLALTLALGSGLAACRVGYLVTQSAGQICMLARREPIARVLQEPDLDPRTRDRLVLVWHARRFAQDVLGLRASASYRDVIRLDRDAASYVVAAAPPDSLEPYRWCFPVAGCLPYIGYFDPRGAIRERDRLRAQGYDVYVRGVEAYSLGGWLPDPVYSSLLEGSRGRVADTVIHELTHGTVFVPGRARFNEGLATFVGQRGALLFLEARYGSGSRTVTEARAEQAEQAAYSNVLHALAEQLRALYAAPVARAEKLRRRGAYFAQARAALAAIPLRTRRTGRLRRRVLNNATLATFETYFGAEARFAALYARLGGDLRRFIAFVRARVARARDPEDFLDRWLREHP